MAVLACLESVYATLVAGSTFSGQNLRDRAFDNRYIRARVSLPFAERKE